MNAAAGGGSTFGALLRGHREAAGLTQEELAERAGLSVRAIGDLERGRTGRPYRSSVRLLVEALGLDADAAVAFAAAARGTSTALAADVPRQLPGAPPQFTGRAEETKALDGVLDETAGTVVISAIGGMAGIGKTALAVHWAHQVADRFPDGQLYVNLRGFDPSGPPLPPESAIRGFLAALGVPPERVPPDLDAAAGLYRSVLAGRRLLIVLDNARDAAQVRPLLPGGPGCLVLVTSRHTLAGLAADGAQLLHLDVLSELEAGELLARRLGPERTAAEPDGVADLVAGCARLPLALAVVAARAADRPGLPLAALAAELGDTRSRLAALDAGDPATRVRDVFSWSYRQLCDGAARMFRLLGVHPGPDVTVPAAASLAGVPDEAARGQLAQLCGASLLVEHTPGRYTFHDLVRTYAGRLADADPERRDATRRMLDHYLHTAHLADQLVQFWHPIALDPPMHGVVAEELDDLTAALDWFGTEDQVLLAGIERAVSDGFDDHAWRLARAVTDYLRSRARWHDIHTVNSAALDAAERRADKLGSAYAHRGIATALSRLGDSESAVRHLHAAYRLFDEVGDARAKGIVLLALGVALTKQCDRRGALRSGQEAVALFELAGDKRGLARALNNLGSAHDELGEHGETLRLCRRALELLEEIDDPACAAYTWDTLGHAHSRLGQHADAIDCFEQALDLNVTVADARLDAVVLDHLGDAHAAGGDTAAARQAWQRSAGIFDELGVPDAERVRAKLAGSPRGAPEGYLGSS